MDIALALKTIVFQNATRYETIYLYKVEDKQREWISRLQVGAGIVVNSDPSDEQKECKSKVPLPHAIDVAESSFVDNDQNLCVMESLDLC